MKKQETKLQEACQNNLDRLGIYNINTSEVGAGVLDGFFIYKGVFVATEYKRKEKGKDKGGRESEAQKISREFIIRCGGKAIIVKDWLDIERTLREIDRGIK